jgi:enoyl-CoA hydratase/carnithine racemase
MNRPEKKNALDRAMYAAMIAALDEAEGDDSIRAAPRSGAGGCFTAGNDLADFLGAIEAAQDFPAQRFVRALAAFPKPVVAAVAGDAVGIGTTLLFHCDLVYAAPEARFKTPFIDLGLAPEAGASLLMPRRFGAAKAAQYLLLGDGFDAAEALRLNLVNAVAPEPHLLEMAMDAARRLAEKPPQALMTARRLLRGDQDQLLARIDLEGELFAQCLRSPEARARMQAFFTARR